MLAMSRDRQDVGGGIQDTDNGEGTKFSGAPSKEGGMTRVQS